MNPMVDGPGLVEPMSTDRFKDRLNASRQLSQDEFAALLLQKLELVKKQQDQDERLLNVLKEVQEVDDQPRPLASNVNAGPSLPHQINPQAITSAILRKLSSIDNDNDQDILDQHVSRVFSPLVQSPGTASPRQTAAMSRPPPPLPPHQTMVPTGKLSSSLYYLKNICIKIVFHVVSQSMRHSRSIPEHASSGGSMPRKTYKNPYDSGVSSDEYKTKDFLKQQMYVFWPCVKFIDRTKTMQNNKYVFFIFCCFTIGAKSHHSRY